MLKFEDLQKSDNIASLLDEEALTQIGVTVVKGYELDESSREEWKSNVDKAMEIAKQSITHKKSFPWPGASNIKFPLIAQASIDYASRTLPEIIQNDKIVKTSIIGNRGIAQPGAPDPKRARSQRVSDYMSYQLLHSPDWEDGTDKLLQTLPVLGTVFKKTYYNEVEKRCISELCVPDKIVVNYGVQSLETARRITHILTMYQNDIKERQLMGVYSDDIDPALLRPHEVEYDQDEDFPIELLEQHCYLDLDGDGYKEPYIVTVHKESKQVLRIVNRFKEIKKKNKKIMSIVPMQYFTDFHFIRSPDGGFYSMGFGTLLLPINTAINTLINQLIDSGTLSNKQGGFLGRGLRLKNGEFKIKMGEWKVLDSASGAKLSDNIFPLPVKEPSQTLFNLLGLLIQVGNDLSSNVDVLQGKQPAQNVASNTIAQLVEQGTKVFIAINKRVYRSLKKEYQKIYDLNYAYLSNADYQNVLDDPAANVKGDFEPNSLDVLPVADPAISSEQQRMARASVAQQLRTVDPRAADQILLESMQLDQEDVDALLPQPDPDAPPPPEAQKLMAEVQKLQAEIAKLSADATLAAERNALELQKLQKANEEADARISESMARVWKMQQDALVNQQKMGITSEKMRYEEEIKAGTLAHKMDKETQELLLKAQELSEKKTTNESK
jgi:chaperonin GroES